MLGVTHAYDCLNTIKSAPPPVLPIVPSPLVFWSLVPLRPRPLHKIIMPGSNITALTNPSSSSGSHSQSGRPSLPFSRSYTDFEMERAERAPKVPPSYTRSPPKGILRKGTSFVEPPHPTEDVFHNTVTSLMTAKSRPFSISGHIPLEPGALTIFLRSQVRSCFFASIFRKSHHV